MIRVTIYDVDTGKIRRSLILPDIESLIDNLQAGEGFVQGEFDGQSFFIKNDQPQPIPPKLNGWAIFDTETETWFDPRTPADLAAELHQRRQNAHLSKVAFIMACMSVGIFSPDEAKAAALGMIPDAFKPVVDAMSPMERDYAEILWGGATLIERLDPFILGVAQTMNISDEELDMIFGVNNA